MKLKLGYTTLLYSKKSHLYLMPFGSFGSAFRLDLEDKWDIDYH